MANVVPQQRKEEDALVEHLEEVAIAGSTKDKIEDYPFFASIYYGGYLFTHTVHSHSSFLTEDGKDLLRRCRNVRERGRRGTAGCETADGWGRNDRRGETELNRG